ncbi:hypothetical protein QR97_31055 [Streptomyces sp. PBH53]|uniref:hypothetical protein n=1 Tax=Streptomyces sp. PBH53 TaxID=1577075 RepID=UPI000655DCCE|nr:hypothetical protein [Streptomyces sp. PBH53]AKN73609.1 hypothetical protein QR97_31055 [Streptomyces sp. PBH53]
MGGVQPKEGDDASGDDGMPRAATRYRRFTMTQVSSARIPLRQFMAVLLTAALTLSLSVILTVTSTKEAAASCSANRFNGTWRSSDARLKRIDVWQGGDCHLYARAWSVCEHDSSRICSWGNRRMGDSPEPNFQFVGYNWNNASEVLHLRMQNRSRISVWDSTDYHNGKKVSFTVTMWKSS